MASETAMARAALWVGVVVASAAVPAHAFVGSGSPLCVRGPWFAACHRPLPHAARGERRGSLRMQLPGLPTLGQKQLPKNIKDSVDQLRGSIQAALQNRCSRIEVEMPYAANFGVEGRKTVKAEEMAKIRKDDAEGSDRELARLIAEMFKGTGIDENMCIAFPDSALAKKAVQRWEFSSVPGKVMAAGSVRMTA